MQCLQFLMYLRNSDGTITTKRVLSNMGVQYHKWVDISKEEAENSVLQKLVFFPVLSQILVNQSLEEIKEAIGNVLADCFFDFFK